MNFVSICENITNLSPLKLMQWTVPFTSKMASVADVKKIWKNVDCVCFDVDSTVIQNEGLDELAEFCGVGDQIKQLTCKAMGGGLPFREALRQRLNILNPTLQQLNLFVQSRPPLLSPGISQLVHLLQALNCDIFLVSGGFQTIIEPIAKLLGIPATNIFSNNILFDIDGKYAGFDTERLTSETGGKVKVARLLKENSGYKNMVFVGDGVTDLEACPPADAFIGYGGNVVRPEVKARAKWFVTDLQELINSLKD